MNSDKQQEETPQLEAVVGIFDDAADADAAARKLNSDKLEIHRVSRKEPDSEQQMPEIAYEDIDEVDPVSTARGMWQGGAIGAGSGLLLLGVPGLNVAAPIVGFLAGTWIGGIAGIEETRRSAELPNRDDYRQRLRDGKSFVVIGGDESTRIEAGNELKRMGAQEVFQHPPIGHVVN